MSDRDITQRYQRAMNELLSEDIAATSISWRTVTLETRDPAAMEVDLPCDFDIPSATSLVPSVTSSDLRHLLDLKMLKTSFTQLRHNFPTSQSLTFAQPPQYIMNHSYSPLDIGSITHTNDGPSALDVRSEDSYTFARFESGIFDIYTSLDQDRKSTRLNSSHSGESRMPSSA